MFNVFPARAGMSPDAKLANVNLSCVPRASGDEPCSTISRSNPAMCSPRERG